MRILYTILFPSKNHEYMVTGTPVLTTKLPCFPEEYDPYLYYMEDVSVDGFYKSMMEALFAIKRCYSTKRKRVPQLCIGEEE